jgi:arylsulfatase A-like enzyme
LPNTPFSGNKSFEHPSTPTDQPTFVNGVQQHPIEGVSMAYAFNNAKAAEQHETQYFEMFGNRGIYHKGWTAVTRHKTPWIA